VAPIDELNVDPAKVAAGAKVFTGMRCAACHTVEMKTGSGHLFAELRNQTIRPYSDLLLHDGHGTGRQVRRRPGQEQHVAYRALWGIGYTEKVMGNASKVGYLHDGRARKAIMWHDGEAASRASASSSRRQTARPCWRS
jgi:CxxC motif-containing protein (DUF1111 family)